MEASRVQSFPSSPGCPASARTQVPQAVFPGSVPPAKLPPGDHQPAPPCARLNSRYPADAERAVPQARAARQGAAGNPRCRPSQVPPGSPGGLLPRPVWVPPGRVQGPPGWVAPWCCRGPSVPLHRTLKIGDFSEANSSFSCSPQSVKK